MFIVFKANMFQKHDLDGMNFETYKTHDEAKEAAQRAIDGDTYDIAWVYVGNGETFKHIGTATNSDYFKDKYHGYVVLDEEN